MSAYAHNFVASIVGPTGQPIREVSEVGDRTVRLPYESEYKIRLKNKNQVRAKVSVLIDGMDISPGRMFILAPNQTLDLERFVQDGDLTKGNKFKFVNKEKGIATGEIQDPYNPSLGLVEVIFHKEQSYSFQTFINTYPTWNLNVSPGGMMGGAYQGYLSGDLTYQSCVNSSGGVGGAGSAGAGSGAMGVSFGAGGVTSNSTSNCTGTPTSSVNVTGAAINTTDLGGTAMGSESKQAFQDSWAWFNTEAPITLSIKLKGLKQAVAPAPEASAPLEMSNLVILDKDGNMLGMVKEAKLLFKQSKNFIEVELTRQIPGHNKDYTESSLISEIYQDQHRYNPDMKVTIMRLATAVTDLKGLAWEKPA